MKIYLRQLAAICMCAVAIACAQSASAQSLGEWEEPPGGYTWPFKAIHMSLMPDAQILTWEFGGDSAHLWNINTGDLTCVPLSDSILFCSGHASLADGSLLVAGGGGHGTVTNESNIYCYGNCFITLPGPWQIGPAMEYVRFYPTCTTLGDGRVLVVAGSDNGGVDILIPEIYNPNVVPDSWSTMDCASKLLPLYPYMFLLPDGKVFFAGFGQNTYVLNMNATPDPIWELDAIDAVNEAVDGTAVMYEPGKVLRIGGITTGTTDNTVKSIDMTGAYPSAWSTAPDLSEARSDLLSVMLADGTVLVVGGKNDATGNVLTAELYDPSSLPNGSWTTMAAMTYPRSYHSTALLLPSGKVLTAGGDDCGSDEEVDGCLAGTTCNAELFSPPYLFAGPRPRIGYAPTTINYIVDFIVKLSATSPVSPSGIAKIGLVRLGSVTHSFDHNQRYVPLEFTTGGIGFPNSLFITAPANGNIAPPGYYMLFLISNAGVPAVAKFVQLQ